MSRKSFRRAVNAFSASTDSTVPFSQLKPEMYRLVLPSGVRASMNVRAQLFGQKWHRVLSSFRDV